MGVVGKPSKISTNCVYTYQMVNHKYNVVAPVTLTNRQRIKCIWSLAKGEIKVEEKQNQDLASFWDELMWKIHLK